MSEETKRRPRIGANEYMMQMAATIWAGCAARPEVLQTIEVPRRPREQRNSEHIDFHLVPAHQLAVDARLRNWGVWCNSKAVASSSPMFRLAAPTLNARREIHAYGGNTVDRADALKIARAVAALPEKHAAALNWCYVKPVSPRRACESIGATMAGLAQLLVDGRQMLLNRL